MYLDVETVSMSFVLDISSPVLLGFSIKVLVIVTVIVVGPRYHAYPAHLQSISRTRQPDRETVSLPG